MNPQIIEPHSPLTPERIREVEKSLGVNFPDSYRNFLQANNGGRPEPSKFPVHGNKSSGVVHWFYGIAPGSYNDMLHGVNVYKGRIPEDLFPIASDPFGNLILIGVKGEHTGKIYFWDHELEADEGEPPTWDNITPVADSFDEFINSF